jgi:hypothetical protein
MAEIFDFFPFDMRPGFGFVLLWLIFSAAVWLVSRAITKAVARSADRKAAPASAPMTGGHTGGYRTPAQWVVPPLQIGVLPQGQQVWAVAYLQDGEVHVGHALMATACAQGWLQPVPNGRRSRWRRPGPASCGRTRRPR